MRSVAPRSQHLATSAALAALAQIHYSRESFDESLTAADRLLELDPENVQGRRYRYLVLDARGDAGAGEGRALLGEIGIGGPHLDHAEAARRLVALEDRAEGGGLDLVAALAVVAAADEVVERRQLARELGEEIAELGAVGDPSVPSGVLERGLLLRLRFAFDHHVNLRPARLYPGV